MPKNFLQDIKINRVKKVEAPAKIEPKKSEVFLPKEEKKNSGKNSYALWFVAGISLVFLLFAFSFLFSGAQIIVTPKTTDVDLKSENLSAMKDSVDSTDSTDADLSFDLITITGQESEDIASTGTQNVSTKASGTVVIYNTFSSAPQILLVNTRLEGTNEKIYKTDTEITVPGMASDGTPGSIAVGVYAADAGADYNSGPLDFKIVGFEGTPRYDKFYGRSEDPIAGGFVGSMPQVSDADKNKAADDLKSSLQASLWQKATDQIPTGFILFKDAAFLDTGDITIGTPSTTSNEVPVTLQGTLYGFIFDETKLTDKLATDLIPNYDGSDVYISDLQDMPFALTTDGTGTPSYADMTNINFTLSGTAEFVWRVDVDKLVSDMLGKNKSDFNQALSAYPNITSANLIVKPVWKSSLPDNPKDISVIVNYPK